MVEDEKKVKKEAELLVVYQLPTEQLRKVKDEKGIEYNVITVEEALSEILTIAKELKKGLL